MAAATPFAEFITNRRRELDMTLGDVASGMGVSPITISNWSSGDAVPEPDAIVALAQLLEVPAEDLAAMAGVTLETAPLKTPEPAVNLMPPPAGGAEDEPDSVTAESTGPIAMLRPAAEPDPEEEPERAAADAGATGPDPGDATIGSSTTDDAAGEAPAEGKTSGDDGDAGTGSETGTAGSPEDTDGESSDAMDEKLAELIEEAGATEAGTKPEAVPDSSSAEQPAEKRVARPPMRRRRPSVEQPVTTLPLTYIEDPKQLTRYRIRWALTFVVLIVLFFILLWASRELLSALGEVMQAVTPGGIGE